MDWSRYPLEKLFAFVAAIIPGGVALLISQSAFQWFFALGFLGYRTKIALVILVAFVVGFTMITFLGAVLGAVGGAIGAATYKAPYSYAIAPWRDPKWRELVKQKLGAQCPNDTRPILPIILDLRRTIIGNLPNDQQPAELAKLQLERLGAESDDLNWFQWYNHYHQVILQPDQDVVWHVNTGLTFSLETAAIYVLVSALVVPGVRHWWFLAPASMWVLLLVGQNVLSVQKATNKWATLSEQVKHLSSQQT